MTDRQRRNERLLSLYANHAPECHCFICRNLTEQQKNDLSYFWNEWGGRKSRTKNRNSPQHPGGYR